MNVSNYTGTIQGSCQQHGILGWRGIPQARRRGPGVRHPACCGGWWRWTLWDEGLSVEVTHLRPTVGPGPVYIGYSIAIRPAVGTGGGLPYGASTRVDWYLPHRLHTSRRPQIYCS